MQFLTLSEKEIRDTRIYNSIKVPHIVISITGEQSPETVVPPNTFNKSTLHLKFDDVGDIDARYLYFTRSQALDILEFVDKHIVGTSLIVVQCHAGISRSVAVAAALSKIINYSDDGVFTKGIPNMFVYTTILETYFTGDVAPKLTKINMVRTRNMAQFLTPAQIRLASIKDKNS